MKRKEMIEEIAKQAGCSKRLVRKKLFNRSAEVKRRYRDIKFNEVFLDPDTNWLDKSLLLQNWRNGDRTIDPFRTENTFEVCFFPSGCIVLFTVGYVYPDGYTATQEFGTRLYSW